MFTRSLNCQEEENHSSKPLIFRIAYDTQKVYLPHDFSPKKNAKLKIHTCLIEIIY